METEVVEALLSPWTLAILGLCIGSFLNVVIHRLPVMLERDWKLDSADMLGVKVDVPAQITLSKPRSRCPSCGHPIAWHENIPVLSYLWLGGKCSACKTRISARYPSFEIATAVLFAAVAWRFGAQPSTLAWCAFAATLVALAGIDWDTTLLPDSLTLPLLWGGLIAAATGLTIPLSTAVWGAVAGYLSLWSVYWLFKLATGKEGMGHGDFKLLAALGAWCGLAGVLPTILLSSLVGALVGSIWLAAKGRDKATPIPFGPYLAIAGWISFMWGKDLVGMYMRFAGLA